MPKKKTSKVMIGLFVTVGVTIGVVVIVWLGASKYFEAGKPYVTYFNESVQGLNPDSNVKYRGVNIGRVERIRIAPDNVLVEVVMKLDIKENLGKDICAELTSAGLTGIMFIDLDRRAEGDSIKSPPIEFDPPYPVIQSRPSKTKQILSAIDILIGKANKIDVKDISDRLISVGKATENILTGNRTNRILDNLDSATAHFDKTVQKVDKELAGGKIGGILDNMKDTIAEARTLVTGIKEEIHTMKLAETAGSAHRMVEGLEKNTRNISMDIKTTSENLRQASESLEALVGRLQANPSDIIFNNPPPPRQRSPVREVTP
jgi:phospholipid/cholesterol/gamma-HCH transport system substrate-binding protein